VLANKGANLELSQIGRLEGAGIATAPDWFDGGGSRTGRLGSRVELVSARNRSDTGKIRVLGRGGFRHHGSGLYRLGDSSSKGR